MSVFGKTAEPKRLGYEAARLGERSQGTTAVKRKLVLGEKMLSVARRIATPAVTAVMTI